MASPQGKIAFVGTGFVADLCMHLLNAARVERGNESNIFIHRVVEMLCSPERIRSVEIAV